MEENKNKIIVASILGLIIIFAAVGTFLVFGKISRDDKVEQASNTNDQGEALSLDVTSDTVLNLYKDLLVGPCAQQTTYFYQNKSVLASNMGTDKKYIYALQKLDSADVVLVKNPDYMTDGEMADGVEHYVFEVSEQKMEEALKKALGNSAVLDKNNLEDMNIYSFVNQKNNEKYYSNISIIYNADKKSFTVELNNGGVCADNGIFSKIVSATKNDTKLTITEKVIFVDFYPNSPVGADLAELTEYTIYADYNHSTQIGKVGIQDYEQMVDSSVGREEFINNYVDKATTVIYTFEENADGSYHFVSSEIKN